MAAAGSSALSHPHRFPANAEYVIARENLLLGGVRFQRGDRLPPDHPVRQNERRLEVLCRWRKLSLAPRPTLITEAVVNPVPEKSKLMADLHVEDLTNLDLHALQELCRKAELSARGNCAQLRKRLASVLDG